MRFGGAADRRQAAVRVWGKGPVGKTVTVSFAGQTATVLAPGSANARDCNPGTCTVTGTLADKVL